MDLLSDNICEDQTQMMRKKKLKFHRIDTDSSVTMKGKIML
jgi:hypothetical protein